MSTSTQERSAVSAGEREQTVAVPRTARLVSRVGNRPDLPRHLANDALRRRMLAAADSLAVVLAVLFAQMGELSLAAAFWTVALLPVWIVVAKLHGLYDRDHRALRHLTADELSSILSWAIVGTAITMAVIALTDPGSGGLGGAIRLWAALVLLDPALRGISRVLWRAWTRPASVLLLGSGPLERATRRKLELFSDIHLRLAGSVDPQALRWGRDDPELAHGMTAACGGEPPDRVIVCSHDVHEAALAEVVTCCRQQRIKLSVVPPLRGAFGTAVRLSHVAELPFVEYHTGDASVSTHMLKRASDIVVSAAALVVVSPVLVVAAIAIKLDSRGPVLYVQRRAGLEGRPFRMLKFRTMVDGAHHRLEEVVQLDGLDDPMFKLRDDPRVTRAGRILRRWSLDELPQLLNVLRGDMSLVGPRPEQVELVERYQPEHRFRLDARPGMTGPMQVFGRGDLAFDERLAVEREYIENVSLGRDIRILAMTIPVVISGRGAF
ncbi:MAG TPA: exopolysaccharide biosynthesis polyprenyl glycosylphosphotransferase [Thermoleophilaceae bacterium]|nr:exopolysaccharide biosynthesis polyprenyl glycosylphosphotransferase [Thermoleophilaceae bacterium]